MASTISANSAGGGGLVSSGDASGVLALQTAGVTALSIDASQQVSINSAQIPTISGTAPLYMCRAWVNFNGSGTVAIRASGNVSSITDNGVGRYQVNFTTALPDINYSTVIACSPFAAASPGFAIIAGDATTAYTAPTTTNILIGAMYFNASGGFDPSLVTVSIFR